MKHIPLLTLALAFTLVQGVHAELKLPAVIGSNMVLQQKQADPIWGWDTPGTKVTVTFAGQTKTADAAADGRWTVKLDPMLANATPQEMKIKGTTEKTLANILIGEVWMCSGQSNMQWSVSNDWKGDIEALASKMPGLRLISVPNVGTQEPKNDFQGAWVQSDAQTAKNFSAVGFFFGRYLHEILGVPVGLINNAWGGSAAEAWVRRESLEKDARFKTLMDGWVTKEAYLATPKAMQDYEKSFADWKPKADAAKAEGRMPPSPPLTPERTLAGNARPGNIFNGVVYPTIGYGMKGVIWYQGESNVGRAPEYTNLFAYMIEQWRAEWKQGDFPFYWVQLADYLAETPEPVESPWAELREAQTKTLSLPNSGQAIITDLGEGNDIHPRNKYDVAARLVRWALTKDYGITVPYRSPEFKNLEIAGAKAIVTFDTFGAVLRTTDVAEVKGFALAGEDGKWQWGTGKIVGPDKVEVSSPKVAKPVAVRYAWANNPVANLYTKDGLPATSFRTPLPEVKKAEPAAPSAAPASAAAPTPAKAPEVTTFSEEGFVPLFNGKDLTGWTVSTKTGHSRTSKNTSGGKWEVINGVITGSQDVPGNGGIIMTNELFGEYEIALEMGSDFGPDSGLFLRSTEDGKCYQTMIDYHAKGNVGGIYGEGLGGKPHLRNYSFLDSQYNIEIHTDRAPLQLSLTPEQWKTFWKKDWNEIRARITGGDKPTITTWVNGVKIMEWTETEARLPAKNHIALQVHGGGDYTKQFVRYRNIRVKKLDK